MTSISSFLCIWIALLAAKPVNFLFGQSRAAPPRRFFESLSCCGGRGGSCGSAPSPCCSKDAQPSTTERLASVQNYYGKVSSSLALIFHADIFVTESYGTLCAIVWQVELMLVLCSVVFHFHFISVFIVLPDSFLYVSLQFQVRAGSNCKLDWFDLHWDI